MSQQNPPKIVLITGTSSGFGLLTAARLASKKYRVVATMRDVSKKSFLLNETARRGGTVDIQPMDVTDKQSVKKAISYVKAEYGYLDAVVNNAGYGIGGAFEDLTDEEVRAQMDVNFFGVQNVTREIIPMMRHRRSGRIINISSVAGFSTSPCFGAYNASKWALEAFSESLMYELKMFGIDVCLIEPGTYKTKIFFENAKYAKNFDNPQSPYYPLSRKLKKQVMDYVNDCHKDPEEIPTLVEKLIQQRNPKFRNIPDIESRVMYALRKFLPFSFYRRLIQKALKTA